MQNLPGIWLWEFSENASLSRREVEQVKAFLSSKRDRYRASYKHHTETVPRQICFAASTNKEEFLTDPTGNRRHVPVVVPDRIEIDIDSIERDRVQLIGEAAARVQALLEAAGLTRKQAAEESAVAILSRHDSSPDRYWLTKADNAALEGARANHTEHDPWEEILGRWLAVDPPAGIWEGADAFTFSMSDVFEPPELRGLGGGPLQTPTVKQNPRDRARAKRILEALGCSYSKATRGEHRDQWRWTCKATPGQIETRRVEALEAAAEARVKAKVQKHFEGAKAKARR